MESKPESAEPGSGLGGVTHVFLDVGGTLLRPQMPSEEIFGRALRRNGRVIDLERVKRLLRTPETILTLIRPLSREQESDFYRTVNARVVEHLGFESDEAVLKDIDEAFQQEVVWEPFPDAVRALRSIRDAGLKVGVISNFSHRLPEILDRTGLAPYVDTITYSFEAGAEKPHPRIFRAAVARAGTTPERAVHVGDSFEADYLGARQAGLHAVLLCRAGDVPGPCPAIRSLEELPSLLGRARSPER